MTSSPPPGGVGGRSRVTLGKFYHDISKNFYKWTLGNRNFFKLLTNFLLRPVEISFFNRLYLRNGASWTPQTLEVQDANFRSSIQIRWQNFKIRFNKKVRNFFYIFLSKFFVSVLVSTIRICQKNFLQLDPRLLKFFFKLINC